MDEEVGALLRVATKGHPGIVSLYDAFLTQKEVRQACGSDLSAVCLISTPPTAVMPRDRVLQRRRTL